MKDTPCILTTCGRDRDGYGRVRVGERWTGAHRLAYCTAHGLTLADIDGKVIMHTCDQPSCVNPDHLVLGTQADNVHDMQSKGREFDRRGENNPNRKLSIGEVVEIRRKYRKGVRGRGLAALAAEYGVGKTTISHIVNNRTFA